LRDIFRAHNTASVQWSTTIVAVVFGLFSLLQLIRNDQAYVLPYLMVLLLGGFPIHKFSDRTVWAHRVALELSYPRQRCLYPVGPEVTWFSNNHRVVTHIVFAAYVSFFTWLLLRTNVMSVPLVLNFQIHFSWVVAALIVALFVSIDVLVGLALEDP
jgi:hypothetical protein